jgi:hypothetical protein
VFIGVFPLAFWKVGFVDLCGFKSERFNCQPNRVRRHFNNSDTGVFLAEATERASPHFTKFVVVIQTLRLSVSTTLDRSADVKPQKSVTLARWRVSSAK